MSQRLERALEVYLDSQRRDLPPQAVLSAHPELADLLAPMLADAPDDADGPDAAPPCFGPYRVLREIGRGGMGVVYEATHRGLGRRVALKVLGDGLAANPALIARFQREARALARLDHPHVVRVLDFGATGERHWLAMDLVEGCSLETRLLELSESGGHRGPSLRQLVEAVAAIAAALHHVHAAGLLHRDVKPANILLRGDGHALLSDFGLARDTGPGMTQVGIIVGTPHYMSPEHLAGGDCLVPASDVFSLGATLYQCITLRRPFDGDSNDLVLQQILLQQPPDPRRLQPGVPVDLVAIVEKSLEKEPTRRYPTAAALAADLRAFLELKPVQARRPGPLVRLRRWARREPWRAALAVLLLVSALLAGFLALQWPRLREAAAAQEERAFEDAVSLGWIQRISNRSAECMAAFRRALALRPHSAEAIAGLCMAMRQFEGGEPALAELDRRAALGDDPELLRRARVLMLQALGRHQEAAAILATLPPPRTATALWFAGTAALVQSDQDPPLARVALEQMSLAARMSPRPRLALVVQWTMAAYRARDEVAQREAARTLLELWPGHPFALHYAALALSGADPARALELCREARAAGMEPRESHWLEVSLLHRLERHQELLAAVRATLSFGWDDRRRSLLIDQLRQLGAPAAADQAVADWFESEPGNVQATAHLAAVRAQDGDLTEALRLQQMVVAARPDQADELHCLGDYLARLDRGDEAIAQFRRALALQPDHRGAHEDLLELLAADAAGALAEHQRWAEARPDDPAAWLALARALLRDTPPQGEAALAAATRADYLAGGRDPAVLECRAEAHAALHETGPERRCREAARALRHAGTAPLPAGR